VPRRPRPLLYWQMQMSSSREPGESSRCLRFQLECFEEFAAAARKQPIAATIVLGSGSNVVADRMEPICSVSFSDIPSLSLTSVAGHRGRLTLGQWAAKRVLVFEGRLHFYEGHSWSSVVRPVNIAHDLGARILLATNAAGGIHPSLGPGSLMAIRDHILWNVPRPWLNPGPGALGPPRDSFYSSRLLQVVMEAGRAVGHELLQGTYASLTGPCYETPAEIRALRAWGADAVGMSTAREVEEAIQLDMECAAVSCITNKAAGLSDSRLDHKEVLATAAAQTERVGQLIEEFLRRLD
jgi:purine-nucleoside phosphorylase